MTTEPIQMRLGGYGPPSTTHSRAVKFIGDRLKERLGDRVDIKYIWNIMDFGYKAEDIIWLVEAGVMTLGYQSTSYFTDRVPELGFVDLPFLMRDLQDARAAFDGPLGAYLAERIDARVAHRTLGYFENGFRHISNRLRPVHAPGDLKDMRIRMLPSDIHVRSFAALGAEPVRCDLTEAIRWIKKGTLDAQENPFANTVTYGVHTFHKHHSMTGHFYLSRSVFVHQAGFDSWPRDVQEAMREAVRDAVPLQRALAVEEEDVARKAIEEEAGLIVEPGDIDRPAYETATQPIRDEARGLFGDEMFALLEKGR